MSVFVLKWTSRFCFHVLQHIWKREKTRGLWSSVFAIHLQLSFHASLCRPVTQRERDSSLPWCSTCTHVPLTDTELFVLVCKTSCWTRLEWKLINLQPLLKVKFDPQVLSSDLNRASRLLRSSYWGRPVLTLKVKSRSRKRKTKEDVSIALGCSFHSSCAWFVLAKPSSLMAFSLPLGRCKQCGLSK